MRRWFGVVTRKRRNLILCFLVFVIVYVLIRDSIQCRVAYVSYDTVNFLKEPQQETVCTSLTLGPDATIQKTNLVSTETNNTSDILDRLHKEVDAVRFEPGRPHMLLILSYQRTGSSFLSKIFSRNPEVFFSYEPLDAFYAARYGTREGWNVPSDITHSTNGSLRYIDDTEVFGVSKYLDHMFNCRVHQIPQEALLHSFGDSFDAQHQSVGSTLSCFKRYNRRRQRSPLKKCQYLLHGRCSRRFGMDWGKMEHCYRGLTEARNWLNKYDPKDTMYTMSYHDIVNRLKDDFADEELFGVQMKWKEIFNNVKTDLLASSSRGANFNGYVDCVATAYSKAMLCVDTFNVACVVHRARVIKTVRATMASVDKLLAENSNLRVLHLVRDPRPVVVSRLQFGGSANGIYSEMYGLDPRGLPKPPVKGMESVDVVKEAELYCADVVRDVRLRRKLERQYPGRFLEVIYEDFVKFPNAYAEKMYGFLDIPYPAQVQQWLLNNTQSSDQTRNSTYIAGKWQDTLSLWKSRQIKRVCQELFGEVDYDWI